MHTVTTIGLDIAKSVFQVHGVDAAGQVVRGICDIPRSNNLESQMAKSTRRRVRPWTKASLAELRQHSKDKLPVAEISKLMKRTAGALRQKARVLGIRIGHRR